MANEKLQDNLLIQCHSTLNNKKATIEELQKVNDNIKQQSIDLVAKNANLTKQNDELLSDMKNELTSAKNNIAELIKEDGELSVPKLAKGINELNKLIDNSIKDIRSEIEKEVKNLSEQKEVMANKIQEFNQTLFEYISMKEGYDMAEEGSTAAAVAVF